MVVINQSNFRTKPAQRAGLIKTGIMPPNSLEGSEPEKFAGVKALVRRQRAEDQEDLVMRLMEAERLLCWRYSGQELENQSKRYVKAAAAMLECSNIAVSFGNLGVKARDQNIRYLSGLKHCGKPICPNCLPSGCKT